MLFRCRIQNLSVRILCDEAELPIKITGERIVLLGLAHYGMAHFIIETYSSARQTQRIRAPHCSRSRMGPINATRSGTFSMG